MSQDSTTRPRAFTWLPMAVLAAAFLIVAMLGVAVYVQSLPAAPAAAPVPTLHEYANAAASDAVTDATALVDIGPPLLAFLTSADDWGDVPASRLIRRVDVKGGTITIYTDDIQLSGTTAQRLAGWPCTVTRTWLRGGYGAQPAAVQAHAGDDVIIVARDGRRYLTGDGCRVER